MSTYKIIIAGFGGQGILSLGQLLTHAANSIEKHASWLPSYGPEMRGGTANCMVVISDKAINSPLILEPTMLIAMNKPSLDKFESKIIPGGLLMLNNDTVDRAVNREDIESFGVNADSIANALGSDKIANMVALGAFIGYTKLLPLEKLSDNLIKVIPTHRHNLLQINEYALMEGYKAGDSAKTKRGYINACYR